MGGEDESRYHLLATGDHREGAPSHAPSIYKEPERLGANPFPYIMPVMDENVMIYRQYFGCLVFLTRYQQTIVDLRKNRKISVNIADISIMDRHIGLKIDKICNVQKNAKKKKKKKTKKKKSFWPIYQPISPIYRPISGQLIPLFFFLIQQPEIVDTWKVEILFLSQKFKIFNGNSLSNGHNSIRIDPTAKFESL